MKSNTAFADYNGSVSVIKIGRKLFYYIDNNTHSLISLRGSKGKL